MYRVHQFNQLMNQYSPSGATGSNLSYTLYIVYYLYPLSIS